jgi:bifunctional UDP-N-acetylglucosamine pyrophosphorylase/glucosamine-1-phosphate N-acetyltransferase
MALAVVILAAGKGTRMQSDLAKVLHPLCGKPLVAWVIEAAKTTIPDRVVVIVGHQAQAVQDEVNARFGPSIEFAVQSEMLGTGHAVQQAAPLLQEFEGDVIVTCGDVPLLTGETLQKLVAAKRDSGASASMLIGVVDEPGSYGRVLCDEDGTVHEIIEAKDAAPEVLEKRTVNAGTYCFDSRKLWQQLGKLGNNNASGEFYLTDVVGFLTQAGEKVAGLFITEREMTGINTKDQLDELEFTLRSEGISG